MLSNPEPAYAIREAYGYARWNGTGYYRDPDPTVCSGGFLPRRGPFAAAKRAEIAAARAEGRQRATARNRWRVQRHGAKYGGGILRQRQRDRSAPQR